MSCLRCGGSRLNQVGFCESGYCRDCTVSRKKEARIREAQLAGREYRERDKVSSLRRKLDETAQQLAAAVFRQMLEEFTATEEFCKIEADYAIREAERRRDAQRERYWKNPDKARHRKKIYKAANPAVDAKSRGKRGRRIVASQDGSLSTSNLNRLFDAALACAYCGHAFACSSDKSLDHFLPLVLGGAHSVANVVICCRTCNFEKNKTHPLVWLGAEMFGRLISQLRSKGAGCPHANYEHSVECCDVAVEEIRELG